MIEPVYIYNATVDRWVDGDTVDFLVDMGFRIWNRDRFRLYGIDTPERGKPGYAEATAYNNTAAPPGTPVVVKTYKAPDKYGRWLCEIYLGDRHLNQELIDQGLAVPYFGGTK